MSYVVSMPTARSRRTEYTESTRQALVDGAVALFTERGYAGTSLDEIARRARVTKGALYHHFNGKQAVFEAAFAAVEADTVDRLTAVVSAARDPWEAALAGLRAYLQVCLEPAYQRLVINEAPVVMGWQRWRTAEENATFDLIRSAVGAVMDTRSVVELPSEPLTRLLFGALNAGAVAIANSSDPAQTRADVQRCVERIVWGLHEDTILPVTYPIPRE